jgi:hypothetical protein
MKQIDDLKQQGYVTRQEYARIIGKTDGGHILKHAQKHNVAVMAVPLGDNGRHKYMFLRADAERLAYKIGASKKLYVGTITKASDIPKLPQQTPRPYIPRLPQQKPLELIEGEVDDRKWRQRQEAKLDMALSMLARIVAVIEEVDAMEDGP